MGYNPEIILAGRRMNDSMSIHVVSKFVKEMIKKADPNKWIDCLGDGSYFKENCPDLRNTRVFDVIPTEGLRLRGRCRRPMGELT